jgi:hypothetical protein
MRRASTRAKSISSTTCRALGRSGSRKYSLRLIATSSGQVTSLAPLTDGLLENVVLVLLPRASHIDHAVRDVKAFAGATMHRRDCGGG